MSQYHTLLLTPWMQPHRIVGWQEAICKLVEGEIEVLESHESPDAKVSSPSVSFQVPSVARIKNPIPANKKGVKFSRINVLTRDNFQCQYCLAPDHKVLTADLRWVPLGDLSVGDSLVGFDEELESAGGRRFVASVVESHVFDQAALYRVTLDGTSFKATAEHEWLSRTESKLNLTWRRTDSLMGALVPRLFTPWVMEDTRQAGWMSGLFDGEGWLAADKGLQVAIAQNPGLVLDQLKHSLLQRGVDFGVSLVKKEAACLRVALQGGYAEQARLLGSIRPDRLLGKFAPEMLGRVASSDYRRVVSVESIGDGEIVKMRTSSSTFIADGFPHHNCGNKFPRRQLNYDHVIPRTQGGKTVWTNIATACSPCNSRKGGRTPEQARMKLIRQPVRPTHLPLQMPAVPIKLVPESWRFWLQDVPHLELMFG